MSGDRRTEWRHPLTGEQVVLEQTGDLTFLSRRGQRTGQAAPIWDEAAERRRYTESLLAQPHLFWVLDWARGLAFGAGEAEATGRLLTLGLTESLLAQLREARQAGRSLSRSLFGVPDEVLRRIAQASAAASRFLPPPGNPVWTRHVQALREEGFVRVTARRPDGALWLPAALEPHRPALEASERPVLRLAADPAREPQPWESRVGGVPYRPRGAPWPVVRGRTGEVGRPLVFLAQLDLAEVNPGAVLPDFPTQGLLQFFILNGDLYGAEFGEGWAVQDRFRVLYWPEVSGGAGALEPEGAAPVPDPHGDPEDGLPLWGTEAGPLRRAVALAAVPDREPVSGADDSASARLGTEVWAAQPDGATLVSSLYDLAPGGHKLGGYPDFTQSDPRAPGDDWALLLQLDSDEALGLMWGDMGTANFFIRPADLRARDFSRVAYHWDCG